MPASPTELTGEAAGKTIAGAKIIGTGDDLQMTIDYTTKDAGRLPDRPGHLRDRLQQGQRAAKLPLLKGFLGYTSARTGQTR